MEKCELWKPISRLRDALTISQFASLLLLNFTSTVLKHTSLHHQGFSEGMSTPGGSENPIRKRPWKRIQEDKGDTCEEADEYDGESEEDLGEKRQGMTTSTPRSLQQNRQREAAHFSSMVSLMLVNMAASDWGVGLAQ